MVQLSQAQPRATHHGRPPAAVEALRNSTRRLAGRVHDGTAERAACFGPARRTGAGAGEAAGPNLCGATDHGERIAGRRGAGCAERVEEEAGGEEGGAL